MAGVPGDTTGFDGAIEHARVLDDARHQRALGDGADARAVAQHRELRDVVRGDERERLAHGRVGRDGDEWRMDFSRFNTYKEAAPAKDPGGWAWSPHGVWDSHMPELFTRVRFSR